MVFSLDTDPALFGAWDPRPVYDGLRPVADEVGPDVVLDVKATCEADAVETLQDMLNGMTKELREQLQLFQTLRRQAQADSEQTGEIDRKQVQVDAKAALEALSLIVRTLEKIDTLQRTIALDQRRADEDGDGGDYEALVALFETRVQERAAAMARAGPCRCGAAAVDDDGATRPAAAVVPRTSA